jgi:hypothetical protein
MVFPVAHVAGCDLCQDAHTFSRFRLQVQVNRLASMQRNSQGGIVEGASRPRIHTTMPRYYFHFRDAGSLDEDQYGLDLPALEDAQAEAREMAHELRKTWDDLPLDDLNNMAIEVTDHTGQTVFIAPFSEAVGPMR